MMAIAEIVARAEFARERRARITNCAAELILLSPASPFVTPTTTASVPPARFSVFAPLGRLCFKSVTPGHPDEPAFAKILFLPGIILAADPHQGLEIVFSDRGDQTAVRFELFEQGPSDSGHRRADHHRIERCMLRPAFRSVPASQMHVSNAHRFHASARP